MPRSYLRCVLIADDLTGACDSAVHFKAHGASSVVRLLPQPTDADEALVEAFTTDTRDTDAGELDARISFVAAHRAAAYPQIIFKKIDSLLRGNPGREVLSAYRAFDCEAAIVTPAYPEMGRTVRDGHLHVHGDGEWEPLHVGDRLREQGLTRCNHLKPSEVQRALQRWNFLSVDATCDADLETLVAEGLLSGRRILWVGSGGLASALAKALFPGARQMVRRNPAELPLLFCVGSEHPVTLAQLSRLRNVRSAKEFRAESCTPESLAASLGEGSHTILRISQSADVCDRLSFLLRQIRGKSAALLLSGGDTASKVCRAIEAAKIELEDQVVPGVPWGTLQGGVLDGTIVATKSGAFGREDTLVQVADFFTCLKR